MSILAKKQDKNSFARSLMVEQSQPLLANGYIVPKVMLDKVKMVS